MKAKDRLGSALVTGGCGFIGSHMVDALIHKGVAVTVLDNLSSSTTEYVKAHVEAKRLEFCRGDVRDLKVLTKLCADKDVVFHFAAKPDVKLSLVQPLDDFDVNVKGTLNVLDAVRQEGVPLLVFASTSTVYGQARVIPTPEGYPIDPISNYGASKSACEVYMMSYSSCYGMNCVSLRYANIFGPRSTHGVVHDFFCKLRKEPRILEILGDGKQRKSYLYITDCIEASMLVAERKGGKGFEAFNIGSEEQVEVNEIARIVTAQLGLTWIEYAYTGGKAGWVGDVPDMLLNTSKMRGLGWQPKVDTKEGIKKYVNWLKERFR